MKMKTPLSNCAMSVLLNLSKKGISKNQWFRLCNFRPDADYDDFLVVSALEELQDVKFIKVSRMEFVPEHVPLEKVNDIFFSRFTELLLKKNQDTAGDFAMLADLPIAAKLINDTTQLSDFHSLSVDYGERGKQLLYLLSPYIHLQIDIKRSAITWVVKNQENITPVDKPRVESAEKYYDTPVFNSETGILCVGINEVRFDLGKIQSEILAVILSEPSRFWHLSEIGEAIDLSEDENKNLVKMRNAIRAINNRIASDSEFNTMLKVKSRMVVVELIRRNNKGYLDDIDITPR